jgi:phage shock protein PspC (stress-responsive transcriptional regulator)
VAAGAQNRGMDISMNVSETPGAGPPRSASPSSSSSDASSVLPPKRLYRDPSGPIGGVAGGFAGYFDVDPVIARLLWIVALFSGIGFPAYLVCWLVIPKAKLWPPPGYGSLPASASHPHQTALLSGFVILGLLAVIGTGADGLGQYLLPAALVGAGVYLLSQRGALSEARAAAPVAPAGGDAFAASATEPAGSGRTPDATPSGFEGLVTPTVLSLLALGAGVVAALHAAGLVHVSIGSLAAGALVLVGAGLLASLWLGRARGLVPLGLGLVCVMLAASTVESWTSRDDHRDDVSGMPADLGDFIGAPPTDGTGKVVHVPATLEELRPEYELGAGELTLDLTALDFTHAAREVRVNLGVGKLLVLVREDAPVEVHGNVGIGDADALGSSRQGFGASLDTGAVPQGAPGKLSLKVNVGIGKAEVRRGS